MSACCRSGCINELNVILGQATAVALIADRVRERDLIEVAVLVRNARSSKAIKYVGIVLISPEPSRRPLIPPSSHAWASASPASASCSVMRSNDPACIVANRSWLAGLTFIAAGCGADETHRGATMTTATTDRGAPPLFGALKAASRYFRTHAGAPRGLLAAAHTRCSSTTARSPPVRVATRPRSVPEAPHSSFGRGRRWGATRPRVRCSRSVVRAFWPTRARRCLTPPLFTAARCVTSGVTHQFDPPPARRSSLRVFANRCDDRVGVSVEDEMALARKGMEFGVGQL